MEPLPFVKMHGLGNDFVVFDARRQSLELSADQVRAIANRNTGVGCDQLIIMEPPRDGAADVFMRIRNADGSEVEACGNATRCVASTVMKERGANTIVIETVVGLLHATAAADDGGNDLITVDMGPVRLDWQDIPLAQAMDTLHLGIEEGPLRDPVGINVGNPHAVFFVDDVESLPLETVGPRVEHHPLFPARINVEAVQVLSPTRLRMRVWERGTGITRACGTGACATLVAAHRRGLAERTAEVVLDGGTLRIEWNDQDHVLMSGPAATSFAGTLDCSLDYGDRITGITMTGLRGLR
ncbi:MAG: diaminopimelate epimerase [Rhodospirillales bacterium]|jgi:diaminopimelate epimerase|nr:diaminopimelate epimerase [Rhodospirillales bacterium]